MGDTAPTENHGGDGQVDLYSDEIAVVATGGQLPIGRYPVANDSTILFLHVFKVSETHCIIPVDIMVLFVGGPLALWTASDLNAPMLSVGLSVGVRVWGAVPAGNGPT